VTGADATAPLRLFVAIEIAPAVRAAIHAATAELRDACPPRSVVWVPAANLHLTLRFLGDQPPDRVTEIGDALTLGLRGAPAFTLEVTAPGVFPSRRRPHVLWTDVRENAALAAVYRKVDDVCNELGFGREPRAFHPHITIGRLRRGARLAPSLLGRHLDPVLPSIRSTRVNTVDLMASELGPGGARYRRLVAAPLLAAPERA
jgi:2'-5' RNA ligase